MASFLLVFALCIVVQSTVAEDCKTTKSLIEDVDERKIQNSWKVVYIDSEVLFAKYSCWETVYCASPDGGLQLQVSVVDNSDGKNNTYEGTYEKYDGNSLKYILPDNKDLTATYKILAVDYPRYKIVTTCLGATNGKPAYGIAFLSWTPPKDDLNAAKEALSKLGLDFKDFKPFCPLSEIKE